MLPPGPIITLVYRVPPERRAALLSFLAGAIPFYERPGGTRVGLYESADEPGLFVELVSYADEPTYAADQERVEHDPAMKEVLARFREVVGGPVEVRRMKPVPELAPRAPAVEPAGFNDHAAITALLNEASLPIPDADDRPVQMIVAREDGRLIGCAGWERHGPVALLRSVAVEETARARGVGRALVRHAVASIEAEGVREIVLLTTDRERFFARLGFSTIERAALPAEVRAARELRLPRCASAVCMILASRTPPR